MTATTLWTPVQWKVKELLTGTIDSMLKMDNLSLHGTEVLTLLSDTDFVY